MSKTPRKQTLYDGYRFPGFTPGREVKGVFGDQKRWPSGLTDAQKTACGTCGTV